MSGVRIPHRTIIMFVNSPRHRIAYYTNKKQINNKQDKISFNNSYYKIVITGKKHNTVSNSLI